MPQFTRRRVLASVIIAAAAVLLLTVFASRGTATKSAAGPPPVVAVGSGSVDITNFTFAPATLTVKAGTTVTWTDRDAVAHTVTDQADGISSPVLNQGDTFAHLFTKPGTYAYICTIHPYMHGTIVVTSS